MMDPDMMQGEFGQLIQQAAKMKGAQMAKDKRRFETWPKYLQHTMYNQEKLSEIRALPAEERLARASEMKEEGNELLKQRRYDDAMNVYEKAIGVYYYVQNRESDWKKKGINDADVKIVDETLVEEGSAEMAAQVAQLKTSVLLNISLAAENLGDHGLSARACSDVLNKLDSRNQKALYAAHPSPPRSRRAPARLPRGTTPRRAALSVVASALLCPIFFTAEHSYGVRSDGGARARTTPWARPRSSTWRSKICASRTRSTAVTCAWRNGSKSGGQRERNRSRRR
jgi:hypothetical protein